MKFVLSVCLFIGAQALSAKTLVDKIVASVGSEVVLYSELKKFPDRIDRVGGVDETLLLGEPLSSLKKNDGAQLAFLVREKIIESEIKRLGMSTSDAQLESEMAQMAKRGRMGSAEFVNYINSQGYSVDEYKKILKVRIERQSFFEREIISKLRITDEDAYSQYQTKNPNYKPSVGEFKIAQIFFNLKKGGAAEAEARAQAAYARIAKGESFETLANQVDETPGANPNGLLGSFKSGEFLPQIEKVIADLGVNEISPIVRGPGGYHIVKLLDKKTVLDPNFLRVKESIKAELVQKNFERQLKNWFEQKKLDANLKIYDNAT